MSSFPDHLKTPLIINIDIEPARDYLSEHIVSFIEDAPAIDNHKTQRIILTSGMLTSAIAAKASFWAVSQQLGKTLGPIAATANSLAFFVIEIWAIKGVITDAYGPKSEAELAMQPQEQNTCKKYLLASSAFCTAAVAQIPSALAAVKYNNPQFKAASAVLLITTNTLIPMRSIQLSFKAIGQRSSKEFAQKINQLKHEVVSLLLANREILTSDEAHHFIQELKAIKSQNPYEKKHKYAELLFKERSDNKTSRGEEIVRKVGECVGLGLTGVFEGSLGFYTYSVSKEELVDNDFVGGSLAAVAVTSSSYLIGTSLQKTMGRIFVSFHRLFSPNRPKSLVEKMRPKLTFVTQAIGFLIDFAALGATVVIWSSFYNKNKAEQYSLTSLMSLSLFTLLFTAMLDTIDEIIEAEILWKGKEEEKEMILIDRKLRKLAATIQNSPLKNVTTFLENIPQYQQKIQELVGQDNL